MEKISDQSVETFIILNQILQPKVFDLISCLIRLKKSKIKVSSNVTIPIWTLFESYPKGIVQRISSHPKLTSLWAMRKKLWG